MFKLGRTQFWISVGLCIAVSAAVPASARLFGKSHRIVEKPRSLVVFPLDQSEEMQIPETLGQDISSALRSVMGGNKKFSMLLYKELLPPIERGRNDTTIKLNEDKAPFAKDPAKPLKLARILAVDCYVVGSIDEAQISQDQKSAQLTITMDMVEAKTGKVLKTIVATGRTPEGSSVGSADEAVALAAGDAVNKLKAQILDIAPEKGKAATSSVRPVNISESASKPKPSAAEKKSSEVPTDATGMGFKSSKDRAEATGDAGSKSATGSRANGNVSNGTSANGGTDAVVTGSKVYSTSSESTPAPDRRRPNRNSGPRRQVPPTGNGSPNGPAANGPGASGEMDVKTPPPPPAGPEVGPETPGAPEEPGVPTAPDAGQDAPPVEFPAE